MKNRYFVIAILFIGIFADANVNKYGYDLDRNTLSGGEQTTGGGDSCEMSFRKSMVQALDWLRFGDQLGDQQENETNFYLSAQQAEKIKPFLELNEGETESNRIYKYRLLNSNRIKIDCTDQRLFVAGKEKGATTSRYDFKKNENIADRLYLVKVNFDRWNLNSSIKEKVALACHEILVMAEIENTDNYVICQNIHNNQKALFTFKNKITSECHNSDKKGEKLVTTRLSAIDQDGTFEFTVELREAPFGKSWLDGIRPGSWEYKINSPAPTMSPPWEKQWRDLPVSQRYSKRFKADCVFGQRDLRLFKCFDKNKSVLISNNLVLSNDGEAYSLRLSLGHFRKLGSWLASHVLAKKYSAFPSLLPPEKGDLQLYFRLNASPKETFSRLPDLQRYEHCQAKTEFW